jgi:ABC-type antimicrobial peptide transport system permease subunit
MRGLQKPHVSAYVHDIKLLGEKSRWFDGTGAKEIVLGHGIAKVMGEDQGKAILEPGDIVNLREENWTVVGVMAPSSTTFGSEIWTDDLIVQKYFGRESNYSSYVIRVTDPKMIKKVTEVMKDRAVVSFGVQAQSERDYYSNLSNTNLQFSFAIYLIAIVMAIGGLLGVMITMYAAVSQRSKDIGVLRLLGYRRWQVLCSFLLEALVIGVVGGILGVLLGSLAHGVEANSIVTGAGGGGKSIILKLTVDSGIILRGFVFSVAMGILGGIFPALSAMRLRPLESLR